MSISRDSQLMQKAVFAIGMCIAVHPSLMCIPSQAEENRRRTASRGDAVLIVLSHPHFVKKFCHQAVSARMPTVGGKYDTTFKEGIEQSKKNIREGFRNQLLASMTLAIVRRR
jgi:hypothetical protein